jgi:hypothetical protein
MNEQINSTESTDVKPCRKCGARERYNSGECKSCHRKRSRKRREANPEKELARVRKWQQSNPERDVKNKRNWREANPEKAAQLNREWCKANPEKKRESSRKWRATNPDKANANTHNRRAKVKGNGGKLSKDIVQLLLIQQSGKCACCGADLSQTGYHLDHIMPLALGGLNSDENVQLLTPTCNLRKGAKHPDKWMPLAS